MKSGLTLQELAREIQRRAEAKQDFLAPVARIQAVVRPRVNDNNGAQIVPAQPALQIGELRLPINEVAGGQLAEYTGIPAAYYKRMASQAPELLVANVNRWLGEKAGEKRLVRTLDASVRAVLSDSYRSLDNEDLAESILPVLYQHNLIVMSSQITERRLYIKAVDASITKDIPTGHRLGDGTHTIFDTLSPAITISNSEVGFGRLLIETGVYTKGCTNLALFGPAFAKYHTGKRQDISDDVYELLTDETKRLTDAAIWSQVRDVISGALDRVKFEAVTQKLQGATEDRVEADNVEEVIEVVGKRYDLNSTERKGVLASLIEGGDLSRYGLHSAITHFSAKVENYDRATDLERIGAKVIDLPRSQWEEVLKEAA